jgi:hypothetical protein
MRLALALLGLATCLACGVEKSPAPEARILIDESVKSDLATLHEARVFFGHHSVGQNILEGLAVLSKEAGIEVKIDEAPVGQNTRPFEKFEDFAKRGEQNTGDGTQLMLMKLCYVDFYPRTDVDKLVRGYAAAVERVRKARPGIRIVHVSPPLFVHATDLKSTLKRTLGRPIWEDQSNAKRLEFGKKLRDAFPGEPFFDLAAVEATRPDGTLEEYDVDGQSVPMLYPGYTSDGGHLNDAGKLVAAKAFAHSLASALRSP